MHRRRLASVPLVLVLTVFAGCADRTAEPPARPAAEGGTGAARTSAEHPQLSSAGGSKGALPKLVDVSDAWQLEHKNETGSCKDLYSIVEVTGGGLAALDFDLDGRPDLFTLGGGTFDLDQSRVVGVPCQLHWNRGGIMHRVGTAAGAAVDDFYSLGAARADVNEDGFEDLIVAGYGGVALLVNQGDATFRKELLPSPPGTFAVAAAVLDLDRDSNLDIYVTNYCNWSFENNPGCMHGTSGGRREICGPRSFSGNVDLIYSRDATGTWVRVENGPGMPPVEDFQNTSMAVLAADLTEDALLDLYVVNDGQANQLFVQQPQGGYLEQGIARGVAVGGDAQPNGSMGIALGDIDANSSLDLVVTNFRLEPIAVYMGRRRGIFQFGSPQIGVNNSGKSYVSWGTGLVDLDTDSDLDLVIVNGNVFRDRAQNRQPGLVFVNAGGKLVEKTVAVAPALAEPSESRGLALADFDVDGRCDLAVGRLAGSPGLLRNATPAADGIWLNLIGVKSPRDPLGAIITLHANPPIIHQWSHGGSYASSHQRGIYLPSSPSGPTTLSIRWPSGLEQKTTLAAGPKFALLVEGREPVYPSCGIAARQR